MKTIQKLLLAGLFICISLNSFSQSYPWIKPLVEASVPNSEAVVYGTASTPFTSVPRICVVGKFKGEINFGDPTISTHTLTSTIEPFSGNFTWDIFIAIYDNDNNLKALQMLGGEGEDAALDVTYTGETALGEMFVLGGYFSNQISVPPSNYNSYGGKDALVVAFDLSGGVLYSNHWGGRGDDEVHGITGLREQIGTVNLPGVFVTGFFEQTVNYNGGSNSLLSKGGKDVFLTRVSSAGIWTFEQIGGSGDDIGNDITITDNLGVYKCYTTGSFQGSVTFPSLSSAGGNDIYVASYDPSTGISTGLYWAKSAGGTGDDAGLGIETYRLQNNADGFGATYSNYVALSGYFSSTADFSNFSGGFYNSFGGKDGYVSLIGGNSGNISWLSHIKGAGEEIAHGVAHDLNGNVHAVGEFGSAGATIVDGMLFNTAISSVGGQDIFYAKYNSSGQLLCNKVAGGGGADIGYDVVDHDKFLSTSVKEIWAPQGGQFQVSASFDAITITSSSSLPNGYVAITKCCEEPSGFEWANKISHNQTYHPAWWTFIIRKSCTDPSGNTYVTGSFNNSLNVGGISTSGNLDYDVFIVKYNSSGTVLWAQRMGVAGTNKDDRSGDIAVGPNGDVYVTGSFDSGVPTFNAVSGYNPTITPQGGHDVFLARLQPSTGLVSHLQTWGTSGDERGTAIDVGPSGDVVVAGQFNNSMTIHSTVLVPNGMVQDVFIASFVDNLGTMLFNWAQNIKTYSGGYCNDVCVTPNGVFLTGQILPSAGVLGSFSSMNPSSGATVKNDVMYFAKLDHYGIWQWVNSVGTIEGTSSGYRQSAEGYSIAYFGSTLYIVGATHLNEVFGTAPQSTTMEFVENSHGSSASVGGKYVPNKNQKMILIKCNENGTIDTYNSKFDGYRNTTGVGNSYPLAVEVSLDGYVYVSGAFTGQNIQFGTNPLNPIYSPISETSNPDASGGYTQSNTMLNRYDLNYDIMSVNVIKQGYMANGSSWGYTLGVDNVGDVYLYGFYIWDLYFSPTYGGGLPLYLYGGSGAENYFLTKFKYCH